MKSTLIFLLALVGLWVEVISGAALPSSPKDSSNDEHVNAKGKGTDTTSHTTPTSDYYNVFHVSYYGQPFLGQREHEGIFVETHDDGPASGHIFQVTGNNLRGMEYEDKAVKKPEEAASLHEMSLIGRVRVSEYARVGEICKTIAVPGKQVALNGKRLDTSGKWTADAIQELRHHGVLMS